jgi:hypothetical protein
MNDVHEPPRTTPYLNAMATLVLNALDYASSTSHMLSAISIHSPQTSS